MGDTALPHVGRTIVNRLLARSVALTRNEDLRDLRAAYRTRSNHAPAANGPASALRQAEQASGLGCRTALHPVELHREPPLGSERGAAWVSRSLRSVVPNPPGRSEAK